MSVSPCLVDHINFYSKWIPGLVDRTRRNGYWITRLVDRRYRNGCWIAQNRMTCRHIETAVRPEGRSPPGSFQKKKKRVEKLMHMLVLIQQLLSRVRIRTVTQTKKHKQRQLLRARLRAACLANKTQINRTNRLRVNSSRVRNRTVWVETKLNMYKINATGTSAASIDS